MKVTHLAVIALLFSSCGGNHHHDGKYKSNVFNGSMTWVHNEEIELNGSEMLFRSSSAIDHKTFEEIKLSCEQFPDRVEFKDKNGITRIVRFDVDGNMLSGEYTYKREGKGSE